VIRLVTLDFWQTLFADTADSLRLAHELRLTGVRAALAEAGRLFTAAEVEAADARAGHVFDALWRSHRDMSAAEQVRRFLALLDPALPGALDPPSLARVVAAYQEPVLTHRPRLTPAVPDAVAALRSRGVVLGVISNTGRTPGRVLRRFLADAGLLPALDVLLFSDEAGVRKPAGAIFRAALARAGVEPDAGVHVGDDPVADVAGARDAGMRAIHFAPHPATPAAPAHAVLRGFADLPAIVAGLG
jgi:putative hydrolase of the HAD superfamily